MILLFALRNEEPWGLIEASLSIVLGDDGSKRWLRQTKVSGVENGQKGPSSWFDGRPACNIPYWPELLWVTSWQSEPAQGPPSGQTMHE